MKRTTQILTVTFVLLFSTAALSGQGPNLERRGPGRGDVSRSGPGARSGQFGLISALPHEALNQDEVDALHWMREEEKLARDVYLALYEQWELPIFWRIASSEQRHMDAVGMLLEKYEIADPALEQVGEFSDPSLNALYNELVAKGLTSQEDALYVGATIEDLDIYDLQRLLTLADNKDIGIVFGNLLKGSMNHLRAFTRLLPGDYEAQYLTQEEVEEILSMPRQQGRYGARNCKCGECGSQDGSGSGQRRGRGGSGN
jgi:hypothetical protein